MLRLVVEKQDDGSYAAYDDNKYDGDVNSLNIGRGDTQDAAIEDLAEAMEFNEEGCKLIRDVLAAQHKGATALTLNSIPMTDEERSGVEKVAKWLDACGWRTEARNIRHATALPQVHGPSPSFETYLNEQVVRLRAALGEIERVVKTACTDNSTAGLCADIARQALRP